MLQNSKIRKKALESLDGNWGNAALMVVIYLASSIVITTLGDALLPTKEVTSGDIPVTVAPYSPFLNLLLLPMGFALTVMFLDLVRGGKLLAGNLFKYYKKQNVWAVTILSGIYIILWMFLLIIPGIIKAYSYSMAPYIVKDNPEIGADAAIRESMKMMKGYKMKLFLLDLSFIGWAILALLTLGLGLLLLEPYMYSARAVFYEELKAERGMVDNKYEEVI